MILQSPAPTPWPTPIGPTPWEVFERYFNDGVYKTWGNISPLYQLDTFDWVILNAVLHHLASPHRGINEALRVARKGAVFIEANARFESNLDI